MIKVEFNIVKAVVYPSPTKLDRVILAVDNYPGGLESSSKLTIEFKTESGKGIDYLENNFGVSKENVEIIYNNI